MNPLHLPSPLPRESIRHRTAIRLRSKDRRGATAALFAAMLPVALAIACYAINLVYMEFVRTELQISMDLSTRAAGRTLAVTGDEEQATAAAERLMNLNKFANKTLDRSTANIDFGVSTRNNSQERFAFAIADTPNSVRIEAKGNVVVPPLFPTLGLPVSFRPVKSATSTQTEMDIALVLDRSGSMAFRADEPTGYLPSNAPEGWVFGMEVPAQARWLDANDAVYRFLQLMQATHQDELVSLATYNELPSLDVRLTTNYGQIIGTMNNHSQTYWGGATNIGGGMRVGAQTLADAARARPWAARVMIVLTDGIHNEGVGPITVAREIAAQKVTIFTITFSNEADQSRMRRVAEIGSGKHIHATSGEQLMEAFEEIARTLPTLLTH